MVVMGDGYDEGEIDDFREYVIDAFESPAHFHETEYGTSHVHIPNDFFVKYWDYINVYMFETISPDSGIDTSPGNNSKKNFFDLNSDENARVPGNLSRMEKVISSTYHKTQLHPDNIDVYIILVNDEKIWAYTYPFYHEINYRNMQPVRPVIIQAPAGRDINSTSFHSGRNGVKTDSIAHELGHAMACLLDEYDYHERGIKLWEYDRKYRNISDMKDGELKWQEFFKNGYESPNPNQEPSEDNDQLLVYHQHPNFNKPDEPYYIPTVNSTMRQKTGSKNYQFGPVNTYHMEGSFKTRLGLIVAQDPQWSYYWYGYPIEQFYNDWLPNKFE